MGNAEIEKILEYVEELFAMHDSKRKEAERKLYANEEMSIEDRIHYATKFCEYNAVCIVLNGIIALIKGSFETEKFWEEKKCEEKKQEQCNCEKNHNKERQEQSSLDIKDITRKELLIQLRKLVNQNQANAIVALECSLGDRGIKDKEIYQIFKYRLEGVIHIINNTDYGPEKNREIVEIISKLYENKIL